MPSHLKGLVRPSKETQQPPHVNNGSCGVPSVLIEEDSTLQRVFAVETCRDMGIEVIYEASNGKEALDLLDLLPQAPALLLIDLDMPNVDGFELIERLNAREFSSPVIIVSSRARSMQSIIECIGSALKLPLLAVLQKPLTRPTLERAVVNWSSHHQLQGLSKPDVLAPSQKELQEAIDSGCICPHFQPQVSVGNVEIVGVEALARWPREIGMCPPDVFIALAEQADLILALTYSIFRQALEQLARWRGKGLDVQLSVNLSPLCLGEPDLVSEIVQLCKRYGVPPSSVILEITESALISKRGNGLGTLARLRLKGFRLSIDDFGIGFSSLQQLARIPYSELKIDRSFITDARKRDNVKAMLRSVLTMARDLNLRTVAEGIETLEDWKLIRSLGCTVGQGYLLARPMPADSVSSWISQFQKASAYLQA